ncbi:MAG: acyl-CoA thioesterase [Opitutales bacterium]
MAGNSFYHPSNIFFDELDALGVLHHTRYLIHLERAQQAFFQELLGVPDFNAERDEDIYVVVHGLEARFRQPVRNPGKIWVKYDVTRVRAGGVTMAFEILDEAKETVYCSGTRTVCKLSGKTHQPTTWTEAFRDALEARLV